MKTKKLILALFVLVFCANIFADNLSENQVENEEVQVKCEFEGMSAEEINVILTERLDRARVVNETGRRFFQECRDSIVSLEKLLESAISEKDSLGTLLQESVDIHTLLHLQLENEKSERLRDRWLASRDVFDRKEKQREDFERYRLNNKCFISAVGAARLWASSAADFRFRGK